MKNIILMMIATSFLLIGCNSNANGDSLATYDNSQLASDLEEERGLQPKLPTEFPIEISKYEIFEQPHESSIHEVRLTGENGEIFTLLFHTAPVTYNDGALDNQEEVTINGNDGLYAVNDITGPSIHWTDGDYHYVVDYQSIELETEVNKETMMAIAESFE
jgi:hypothetical protein